MPPARRVGARGKPAYLLPLRLVGHAVERQQVDDVAVLEAHPAGLQPADLRVGSADDVPASSSEIRLASRSRRSCAPSRMRSTVGLPLPVGAIPCWTGPP